MRNRKLGSSSPKGYSPSSWHYRLFKPVPYKLFRSLGRSTVPNQADYILLWFPYSTLNFLQALAFQERIILSAQFHFDTLLSLNHSKSLEQGRRLAESTDRKLYKNIVDPCFLRSKLLACLYPLGTDFLQNTFSTIDLVDSPKLLRCNHPYGFHVVGSILFQALSFQFNDIFYKQPDISAYQRWYSLFSTSLFDQMVGEYNLFFDYVASKTASVHCNIRVSCEKAPHNLAFFCPWVTFHFNHYPEMYPPFNYLKSVSKKGLELFSEGVHKPLKIFSLYWFYRRMWSYCKVLEIFMTNGGAGAITWKYCLFLPSLHIFRSKILRTDAEIA